MLQDSFKLIRISTIAQFVGAYVPSDNRNDLCKVCGCLKHNTFCVLYQCEFLTYNHNHSHKSENADLTVKSTIYLKGTLQKTLFYLCPSCFISIDFPLVFSLSLELLSVLEGKW